MTIAMCYMSPEGVVLGADSTSSALVSEAPGAPATYHYLNHHQKLFELGTDSTIGILTWGMSSLSNKSHRTQLAILEDGFSANRPASIRDIVDLWAAQFWADYLIDPSIVYFKDLAAKAPFDPQRSSPGARTEEEEKALPRIKSWLQVGFCVAGYWEPDRTPTAFQISFDPTDTQAPMANAMAIGSYFWWGAPNVIKRLINGSDDNLKQSILQSGQWIGSVQDLDNLLNQHMLGHPLLPIRDAIDFVHTCIHSTIKAMKFSNLAQTCGGPIELAVITTDRKFRWVRHKPWDVAITEGDLNARSNPNQAPNA